MFSGIVEGMGLVSTFEKSFEGARISISSEIDFSNVSIGASIAVDGVCLTVVAKAKNSLSFDLASETLRCTTLGTLRQGSKVNVERSLRLGDAIDGHLVTGHVDMTLSLKEKVSEGSTLKYTFDLQPSLRPYLVPKGSICISGVSLTVGEVKDDHFSVYIIPHTAQITTLGGIQAGDRVNCEIDMLARYVERQLRIKNCS